MAALSDERIQRRLAEGPPPRRREWPFCQVVHEAAVLGFCRREGVEFVEVGGRRLLVR